MGRAYLLTGEPGIDKTAALKKVVKALGTDKCGGFYTKAIGTQEEVSGFNLVTLDRHIGLLAAVYSDSPWELGDTEWSCTL